jgi:transposase
MSNKKFSKSFKTEAVRRVIEQEQTVAKLSRELGIHVNTLYKWVNEFKNDNINAFPGSGNLKPEDAEIRKIKRENETLKEEVEILKKAAAFFAKNLK